VELPRRGEPMARAQWQRAGDSAFHLFAGSVSLVPESQLEN